MSDKTFFAEIVTPKTTVFSGDVLSVTVPGDMGSFQVLLNHAPILSSLSDGLLKIVENNGTESRYTITSGFIEVHNNKTSIVTEAAEKK